MKNNRSSSNSDNDSDEETNIQKLSKRKRGHDNIGAEQTTTKRARRVVPSETLLASVKQKYADPVQYEREVARLNRISEYELERDNNIARNEALQAALELGDGAAQMLGVGEKPKRKLKAKPKAPTSSRVTRSGNSNDTTTGT